MSILEFAEDIFTLRTNVTSLKDKVTELSNTVLDHEKRIIRLEGSEDRILANINVDEQILKELPNSKG